MNVLPLLRPIRQCLLLALAVSSATSCRKHKQPERLSIENLEVVVATELLSNRLDGLYGGVYEEHKDSPILWQPWDDAVFKHAKESKRLVFCVVTFAHHPDVHEVLRQLESDSESVDIINNNYVPVLVDGEWCREFHVLSCAMSREIKRSPGYPMFIWLEYNGNPVACTPVSPSLPGGVRQVFDQSHSMIDPMWEDDLEKWMADGSPGYVLNNSAYDMMNRERRLRDQLDEKRMVDADAPLFEEVIRQLISDYDVFSHGFDSAGGLFPVRQLKLLADASAAPGVPADLRSRASEAVNDLLSHTIKSAMFDPLDQGVFHLRRARTWDFPIFLKSGFNQAEIANALLKVCLVTKDRALLDRALVLMRSIEGGYRLDNGLFVQRPDHDSDFNKWMWSVDEVRDVLGDDAELWIQYTGMRELGNVPLEADPTRKLFRKNSLETAMDVRELAVSSGLDPKVCAQRIEDARSRMLEARNARLRSISRESVPHLGASLEMVAAYATAYRLTADKAHGHEAVALMKKCREEFADGAAIRLPAQSAPEMMTVARAFQYAQMITAALEVHALQPDGGWLEWVNALWQQVETAYVDEGLMLEYPKELMAFDLPLVDTKMVFGDSTMGLMALAAERSVSAGASVPDTTLSLLRKAPDRIGSDPIVYADRLHAMLMRHYRVSDAR